MSETLEMDRPAAAEVKGGLVTYLNLDGAFRAAELYAKAFGAQTIASYPPDESGRTMHIHLHVNGSSLMISDFYPEHGHAKVAAAGFSLTLMVKDCDAAFDRAVAAGCEPTMPPADMFWGDRYAAVRDPFGVAWAFNQGK